MTDKNKSKRKCKSETVTDFFAEYKLYVTHEKMRYNSSTYQGGVYGNQIPANDPEYAFDDRYFEKSLLKHSFYFDRMRELRDKVRFYTDVGFLPERYCEEYPLPFGNVDVQCCAQVEFSEDFKRISLDTGQVFFIYEDSGVHIFNLTDELPELYLACGSFLQIADAPLYDLFISKGIVPETTEKTYRICSLYDTIGCDGGTFSLNFEVSNSGKLLESTSLEIKLFKRSTGGTHNGLSASEPSPL